MSKTPVSAYDVSRRVFLGGLPPSCTRNDIVTLVKQRTRVTPNHVEIALVKNLSQNKSRLEQKEKELQEDGEEVEEKKKQNRKNDEDQEENNNNDNDDDEKFEVDSDGDPIPIKKNKNNNKKKSSAASQNQNQKKEKENKKPLRDCRGFAHFTAEGLRNVIENMQGAQIHGKNVTVKPARPHYLWKIDKARRDRERADEKKKEEALEVTQREGYGELDLKNKPMIRSMDAAKNRFHNIASDIAAKMRRKHQERKEKMNQYQNQTQSRFSSSSSPQQQMQQQRRQRTDSAHSNNSNAAAASASVAGKFDKNKKFNKVPPNSANAKQSSTTKTKEKKTEQPAPAPAPVESKQDRKLSALEARLAALQAKLKK